MGFFGRVRQLGSRGFDRVKSLGRNIASGVRKVGNFTGGVANGISKGASWVKNALQKVDDITNKVPVVGTIVDAATDPFQSASNKVGGVARDVGGIADTISRGANRVNKALM